MSARASGRTSSRSPTRRRVVLRHDQGFLATVMAQPIMMLLLFGCGSRTSRRTCRGRCSTAATASRRAASSRTSAVDRLLPGAASRSPSYDEGRALLRARRGRWRCSSCRTTSAATSSAGGRRCSSCSTAPIRSPRRASAATSARSPRASTPGGRRRRGETDPARRASGRSTSASASGSTRRSPIATSSSRRSPACCSPTSACRRRARHRRRARERHLRADAVAADHAARDRARQAAAAASA